MTVRLIVSPAASGKTAWVLNEAAAAARGLEGSPIVVVPRSLQVRALRRRLGATGGAIGVRIVTFEQLYSLCLNAAGEVYTQLTREVTYRLLRSVVDELPLSHYAPIVDRPGLALALQDLIAELKAGRVWPEQLESAVADLGSEPRLQELASVYSRYQSRLGASEWADYAGMGWLAAEALESRAAHVGRDWPLLVVDGFDNFTQVQIDVMRVLSQRVGRMIVTLTGEPYAAEPRRVHDRFARTRQRIAAALAVTPEALPDRFARHAPELARLEASLFTGPPAPVRGEGHVELLEAPDRRGEVREAMRWLKSRLVLDATDPRDIVLLARDVAPYRNDVLQTAAEFGIPIEMADGLPLGRNPAVAALLHLLQLMLPDADGQPSLPRRLVVEAWRSPYFDWPTALATPDAEGPIGIATCDADALDNAARWGRVMGGWAQWSDALGQLAARATEADGDPRDATPPIVPTGDDAKDLAGKMEAFVTRLTPPDGARSYREFVGWLESIIGPDPELPVGGTSFRSVAEQQEPHPERERDSRPEREHESRPEPTSLGVVARARGGRELPAWLSERDLAALHALKDVLRGLVWAGDAIADLGDTTYERFVSELESAIEATDYRVPTRPDRECVLVASVVQARGIAFRAAAVLGMSEGEFPTTLREDALLRDSDRSSLREGFGLSLDDSTSSAEMEFFYETVCRARERLLLTRPRLADNGAPWTASPFWEEVLSWVDVAPQTRGSDRLSSPARACSVTELLEHASAVNDTAAQGWAARVAGAHPTRWAAIDRGAAVIGGRRLGASDSPFDGALFAQAPYLETRFGPDRAVERQPPGGIPRLPLLVLRGQRARAGAARGTGRGPGRAAVGQHLPPHPGAGLPGAVRSGRI